MGEKELLGCELLDEVVLMILCHWEEEGLLVVLAHQVYQLSLSTLLREEDLAFTVDDELLQVVGYMIVDTEVLHVVRYRNPKLLAEAEEMLHSLA